MVLLCASVLFVVYQATVAGGESPIYDCLDLPRAVVTAQECEHPAQQPPGQKYRANAKCEWLLTGNQSLSVICAKTTSTAAVDSTVVLDITVFSTECRWVSLQI